MSRRARNTATARRSVWEQITDRIVATLEAGEVAPWHRPWSVTGTTGVPHNPVTGTRYRGINVLLCMMTAWERGYSSQAWVTFKGANELAAKAARAAGRKVERSRDGKRWIYADGDDKGRSCGGVRKGQNAKAGQGGTPIVFWKPLTTTDTDKETGEETERSFMMLRTYTVFNIEQCDEQIQAYVAAAAKADEPLPGFTPIERAEAICEAYGEVQVTHGGDAAFYSPKHDRIQLPAPEAFATPAHYYSVRFHESAHSTGHVSRLNRDGIARFDRFGSHQYSQEELVAEFAACFLSAEAGIERVTEPTSTSYLKNWAAKLRDDSKLVVYAAQQAQHAADYVLGRHASQADCQATDAAA